MLPDKWQCCCRHNEQNLGFQEGRHLLQKETNICVQVRQFRYFDKAIKLLIDKQRRRKLWKESNFIEVIGNKEEKRYPISIDSDSEQEHCLEKLERPDKANTKLVAGSLILGSNTSLQSIAPRDGAQSFSQSRPEVSGEVLIDDYETFVNEQVIRTDENTLSPMD